MVFWRPREHGDGLDMADKGKTGFKGNSQVPVTQMGETGRRTIWEKEFYFGHIKFIQERNLNQKHKFENQSHVNSI